jgi:hypothetical protein
MAVVWDFPRAMRLVVLAVVLGVGANVALTLVTKDRGSLEALRHLTPGYLVLALTLALVPGVMESVRLLVWARFFGRRLSWLDALRCVMAGQVGASLAPIAVGNAAAKTAMLVERGLTPAEAAAAEGMSVIEDFLFFVLALPVAAVVTGAWRHPLVASAGQALAIRLTSPWVVSGLIAALLAAAAIMIWLMRRRGRLFGVRDALKDVWRRGKSRIAITTLIAAVHWSARYSVVAALALSFGVHENPVRLFFLQWFVFTIMTFVPLPGAAVGAESAFYLVYNGILPEWSLGVMTAAWRLFSFYLLVIIAAVGLVVLPHRPRTEGTGATEARS